MIGTILSFLGGRLFKAALLGIAVAAVSYLYYDFISCKEEMAVLNVKYSEAKLHLTEFKADYESLNRDLIEVQEDYEKLNGELFTAMTAICSRTDTVDNLNVGLSILNVPLDITPEAIPQAIIELEESLNKRLNDRKF